MGCSYCKLGRILTIDYHNFILHLVVCILHCSYKAVKVTLKATLMLAVSGQQDAKVYKLNQWKE